MILAADDDQDIRQLVAFRLERSGYTVLQARDGEEALALALEQQPDLAVLDVMMPKIDGFEVTRRLRAERGDEPDADHHAHRARRRTPTSQEGFDAGADDYLRKPFSPQELRARVQAILGRR